jgi:tagaturonate reductase
MEEVYLNKSLLYSTKIDKTLIPYDKKILDLPTKIIQFGEGNFIRAFFDYFIHKLNCNNLFNGRIAVLKPREGSLNKLREQDCLFTLITAGLDKGKTIYEKEIIASIGEAIDTYRDWQKALILVKDSIIKIIVSNTTETGIKFERSDKFTDSPPSSFPAKLTQVLYERFASNENAEGFIIIPLELIEYNGDILKDIVLQYVEHWNLGNVFTDWVKNKNLFVNTLVDRIVPGYPTKAAEKIFDEIGYRDNYLTFAESYHLFAIEETKIIRHVLPFDKVGLNVVFSDDISVYRDLKLRILNGTHTAMVSIAILKNVNFVKDIFMDETLNKCLDKIIFNEIVPTLLYEKELVLNFANEVIERFKNPYIEHKWSDIFSNSITKFQIRLFPTINKYYQLKKIAPNIISFSYALLIYLFKDSEWHNDKLVCKYNGREIVFTDEKKNLIFLNKLWKELQHNRISADEFINKVINNKKICNIDKDYAENFGYVLKEHLSCLEEQNFGRYFETISGD